MATRRLKDTRAFTLTELLVTMAIGMVTLAAVTTTFMTQARFYNAQEQVNQMEQNARGALDVITRELKMAGYNPAGGSFYGVTYSASQLMIQADLDSSGSISTDSTKNEQIVYAFDNANNRITRRVGTGSTEVLADNITAFTFSYLDASGASTSVSADIRQVAISITAQTANPDPNYAQNNGYRTYQIAATVTPVNLGL
ncbi:MAG TPA: prepilin-type N-terminal cleavage/methylation domain-containing protein [candidate division Zixibacteria bacterium]|nr:prepilin-type N-terminal cleavage/methylation domain-containing protein [candidate division Zixibacteria bacterium]